MVKTLCLTIVLLVIANVFALSQGKKSVVIGTMIDRPNAVLVINPPNKDQGFLLPQLTSAERLSIAPSSPQDDGLVVFDTSDKSFYFWSGGAWIKGLGDNISQVLSYDAATQNLTLSGNGGLVSLAALKEIPATTGEAGKFLTTDGTTLSWATLGVLGDITSVITGQGLTGGSTSGDINLSVNTDGTTISVNGSNALQLSDAAVTTPKIAVNAVNSSHIIDGSVTGTDILDNTISTNDLANAAVTGVKIANGAVSTTNISSGGNSKVLSTNGAGVVTWIDRSSFDDDNQGLALVGNTLNIDNGVSANLNNLSATGDVGGPLNSLVIQPNVVNSAKIQDGSISTADIGSGGNNKVLTTDGAGAVNWADRSTFTDDNQNLGFAGNTLTIDNGTGVNLSASGQVTGLLDNLVIQPGAANQVMVTNPAGTASVWTTPGGDITGPLTTTTVGRIQGRDVNNAAPNNGEALIWNGAAWAPAPVTASPTVQFAAIDPANFQPMEPGSGTTTLGLFTSGGGTYVFAKGSSRQIMAAVNLPHGATVQSITVYYEYTLLLGPMTVNFDRKPYGGLNQILTTVTPLLALGNGSTNMPAIAAPDAIINNSAYTYRIIVTFSNILDANDANGIQRVHGIRIQYSK